MSRHQFDRGHSHKSRLKATLHCSTTEIWPSSPSVGTAFASYLQTGQEASEMAEESVFLSSALGNFVMTILCEFQRSLKKEPSTDVQHK